MLADAAATFTLRVRFVSSAFAHDYARLSRPVYFLELEMSGDGTGDALAYFDMSAQHVVNEANHEPVGWASFKAGAVTGAKIGTTAQCVLCEKGDKTNINWGYVS